MELEIERRLQAILYENSDVASMVRQQYYRGEIAVAQEKTGERVWIPASRDLRAALDPWLAGARACRAAADADRPATKVDHMRHLMRAAMRAAGLPDDCTLHRLRYTFATRAIELGLDWQTIESIVGHKTADMAFKYTQQRRLARLAIVTLDAANGRTGKAGSVSDERGDRSNQ